MLDIEAVFGELRSRTADVRTRTGAVLLEEEPVPAPQAGSLPSESKVERVAIVLGAKLGGTHIMKTLADRGVKIAGVYDQNTSAPGIVEAQRRSIPVYAGAWTKLTELLMVCKNQNVTMFYVFLPTRDQTFSRFAIRTLSRARAAGFRNFTVLKMDTDFSDYEPADKLCALMGINP